MFSSRCRIFNSNNDCYKKIEQKNNHGLFVRQILLKLQYNKKNKMGCASSQTSAVSAVDNITSEQNEKSKKITEAETDTLERNEILGEPVKYPPAEAFEIPLDDDQSKMNDSIIKRHPPKRLLRLTEQTTNMPTTIEDLEEKLAKAELRRQKYLQQRIEGAANSIATRIIGDEDDNEYNDKVDENSNDSDDVKAQNSKNLKTIGKNDNNDNNKENVIQA